MAVAAGSLFILLVSEMTVLRSGGPSSLSLGLLVSMFGYRVAA